MASNELSASFAASATATLQTLVTFNGANGSQPSGGLVMDAAGNFYGTTSFGGSFDHGTVFEIAKTPTGYGAAPTTLVTFDGNKSNGFTPGDNLFMDAKGDLIGTTGGVSGEGPGLFVRGSIFELAKKGAGFAAKATTLVHFRKQGGYFPNGTLTADSKGDIFGTTSFGPRSKEPDGTVFEVGKTTDGYRARQTLLAGFKKNDTTQPSSNLVVDGSGNLIGATSLGGSSGNGEIFELVKTKGGYSSTPTKISDVGQADFLVMDKAGDIFGTGGGGPTGDGTVFELIKTGSTYATTILANFDNADGSDPRSVSFDTSGNIYGTTYAGGAYGKGTVFEIAKTATGYNSTPTTVYSFTGGADGASPVGSLSFDAAGNIYGTTAQGGTSNDGTVFELTPGGSGNAALCFCTGTRIATTFGEVAVEALAVGDLVVTVTGGHRAVTWVGHRRLDRPGYDARPAQVAAHAFGNNRPARDLWLSPGHPVLVGDVDGEGGHLVPIMCLINGTTIERVPVNEVTYWHVELDAHDILLAEGLPAESYLDWGDRAFFTEGADHALANPDFVIPGLAGRCRPVAVDGPVVEAARAKLDRVFAMRLVSACAWPSTDDQAGRSVTDCCKPHDSSLVFA